MRHTKSLSLAGEALVIYRFMVRISGISPAAVAMMSLFFSLKLLLYMTYPMIIRTKDRKEMVEGPLLEAVNRIKQYPYMGMRIL